MSEPFIAEIRIFAGNFAPRGWAFCDGQLLPISQNTALFSLIGTIYGGDGRTTTGLPNLKDRAPMHAGRGPGLTVRGLGQRTGTETVTLTEAHMPAAHSHLVRAPTGEGNTTVAAGNTWGVSEEGDSFRNDHNVTMHGAAFESFGGGNQAHTNMQPLLGLNFIIALTGLFPSRS